MKFFQSSKISKIISCIYDNFRYMCVPLTGSERGEDPDQPLGHPVVPGCSGGSF